MLLGPSGIGKTRAARAWASGDAAAAAAAAAAASADEPAEGIIDENAAPLRFPPTVGADPLLRTMTLPDRRRVAVALWDCGGGGGGGGGGEREASSPRAPSSPEASSSSSPEASPSSPGAACSALGGAFFAGACAIILAYSSESSAEEAEAALGRWLEAAAAAAQLGASDEVRLPSLQPPPPLPVVVVVGLRARKEQTATGADEAAARWAAEKSLRHFLDLGAAASAATLMALEGVSSSFSSAAAACPLRSGPRERRWGAADSASDAAEVLGSLKCLGGSGGAGGGGKKKMDAPACTSVVAAAAGGGSSS